MNKPAHHVKHEHTFQKTTFGFWIYLMTDCVIFASLFATYAVLHNNTAGGASAKELFSLPLVLTETLLLLASSLTAGLALLSARFRRETALYGWMLATFVLGGLFLGIELWEFTKLVAEGNSWQASGFLTSYFTLVGTHGLHIAIGLLWLVVLAFALRSRGITNTFTRRLTLFSLFWHFLDIIWICIFTLVYLMGAV